MNLPFFIARRYLFAKKSHNVINIISAISVVGMAIGTAALIIIMSVYNGFDGIIRQSLSDLDPDYLITPSKGKVFIPEGKAFDWAYDCPYVYNMSGVLQENVFVNYDNHQGVARAKGVDSVFEEESGVASHVRQGEFKLHNGSQPMCAVGSGLAYRMGINPNFLAPLEIYFPARDRAISLSNPMASIESVYARPSCTFSINSDVDASLLLLPLETMRELLGYEEEVSAVEALRYPVEVRNARKGSPDAEKVGGLHPYEKFGPRIDYIYVSPGVRVLDYETVNAARPGKKLYPSDHFPVTATVLLP
mgnify:CR=1 FL=1